MPRLAVYVQLQLALKKQTFHGERLSKRRHGLALQENKETPVA
jgi:hypothetical protein